MSSENSGNGLDATLKEFAGGQKLFGRYTLIKTLGRGGMGVVWLARDEELERNVALKFLPELIIHDRAVLGDMKRETRRSLELTHKNIVRIYDFVHDEQSGCISMEYVDGDTLSNLRADKPRKVFDPFELADWASQLCDALDYAHNHARIIHRDLKPANLMVNQRGDLKVADFGIARSLSDSMSVLTMDRGKSGTLLYMSPQQLDGERGTHLDDVYSFGASMYELITSKPPFYSGNVDRQIREKAPARMTDRRKELEIEGDPIDETWEDVVRACLAKDPARRPPSVSDVAKQLAVPSPKTRRAARAARAATGRPRSSLGIYVIGGAVLLCALAGGWFLFRGTARQSPKEAVITAPPPAATIATTPPLPAAVVVGGVIVDTSPSGATVTLGGMDAGKSPITFKNVQPGKYPLRVVLEGYEPFEKQVEIKGNEFTDIGTITLQRGKATLDLTSAPAGARVFQNGSPIGTTPIHRDDLGSGDAVFLLVHDGYLPREIKLTLEPKKTSKQEVALAQPAPAYAGSIRVRDDYNSPPRPITIALGPNLKSGTMTQGSKHGDFVVRFSGLWEGTELHAVTGDVIAQPSGIKWSPESFTLRFGDDGRTGSYQCSADSKTYIADLSGQAAPAPVTTAVYKGKIQASDTPLTINLGPDRKSGTMTQGSKSGDVVVKFNGVTDGEALRAVTGEVVSKPKSIQWKPESFVLHFKDGGKHATYECNDEGRVYTAELSTP